MPYKTSFCVPLIHHTLCHPTDKYINMVVDVSGCHWQFLSHTAAVNYIETFHFFNSLWRLPFSLAVQIMKESNKTFVYVASDGLACFPTGVV